MNGYKFPIRVHFDPYSDPELAKIFDDPVSRNLYLLWRTHHAVGEDFCGYVTEVAENISQTKPTTPEQLIQCFFKNGLFLHPYWRHIDVDEFCHRSWPFFNGEQEVTWELVQKENQ